MAIITTSKKACSVNPLKMSQPIGGSFVFKGLRGAMPLLHGSQGCTSFGLTLFVRHFKEAVPMQTTAMSEVATVLGGYENVEQAVLNIYNRTKPEIIGINSTGVTETKGDDVEGFIRLIRQKQCPITGFLHGLANSKGETPNLTLEKYEMADRDPLSGELQILPNMQTYLLLIDHDGFAHNLDGILTRSGDKADFKITLGLDANTGAEKTAVPQILLAIATTAPIDAAKFGSSTEASVVLPKILSEMSEKNIEGGATARYFRIRG